MSPPLRNVPSAVGCPARSTNLKRDGVGGETEVGGATGSCRSTSLKAIVKLAASVLASNDTAGWWCRLRLHRLLGTEKGLAISQELLRQILPRAS